MFRLTKQTGWVATLLLLSNLGWAVSFDTPPLLKPAQLLPRNKVNLPSLTTLRPALTGVTPSRCTSPGDRLVLGGRNLGQRGTRQLVMDTGRAQVTLVVISWTASRITTRLPRRFNHRGKVEIGIRYNHRWLSTPLPVVICSAIRVPLPTGVPAVSAPLRGLTPPLPPLPTTPVSTPAPAEPSPPVTPSPAASSDLSAPTSAPADDNTWSNSPDNAEQIPPARLIGGGTLLGAALPPVPAGLQLVVPPAQGAQRQYAPHELVAVTASMKDAKRLAQVMGRYQARVIRRRKLGSLGMVISTFRLPGKVALVKTLRSVRTQYPGLWIDVNHYFRPQATPNRPRTLLYRAIGWHFGQHCGRGLRVGILDGPVDMTHPALSKQAVVQKRLFARGRTAASTRHATAVASLLVGNPAVPGLGGIINQAHLYVGVVMQANDDDQYSTAEDLLSGLNWLLEQRVQVISLSLGGEPDALLRVALQRTLARGVGVVAAAGNGGAEAPPSYPAAQIGVVAVTSVDSEGVVARDANRGNYIDLAAPGVDVWVAASQGGGRYASGTSMAAPLVAAALAQLGGKPAQVTHLFRQARDLGKTGKDPVYGWGLLQFPACSGT